MAPEHEELIQILSRQIARRYGYDPDDTLQEARIIALKAVEEFDPTQGDSLGKCIRYHVTTKLDGYSPRSKYWRLKSCVKNRFKANAQEMLPQIHDRPQSASFLTDLLDELSEDAQTIVSIILDTPGITFQSRVKRGDGKSYLERYLRKTGWTKARIIPAFSEIEEALSCPAVS